MRTSPHCPQSNGKLERWHGSLMRECIRPGTPLSLEDARRLLRRREVEKPFDLRRDAKCFN